MMESLQVILSKALKENQIELFLSIQEKLLAFLKLLEKWNRTFNLTTITEPHEMIYLHLIDSLIIQPYLQGTRMLDVGSGGGLPGIPLAIVNPNQQWTLLDKNSKKTKFLSQVIAELGLKNVEVIHSRCEDFHPTHCFDSILSRAFGTIRMFAEMTAPLLCPYGVILAMKGKYPAEELADLPDRFQTQIIRLTMQGMQVDRHIVLLKKV